MSSSEPNVLTRVRHLIASGDNDSALEQLNKLLREHPNAEAHTLRLRILTDGLVQTEQIHESLLWLERHQPDSLAEAVNQIEVRLMPRLDSLRASLADSGGMAQINDLDDLLPLAERFPAVHVVRGLAFIEAARPRAARLSSFGSRPAPSRYRPDELPKLAEQSLERALSGLTVGDMLYADAVGAMAALHEAITGDLKAALAWYRQGIELGLPLAEKAEHIQRELIKQTITHFTQALDGLMNRGQLERAAYLLNACGVLERLPSVRVRLADLRLLQGSLTDAEALYKAILESFQCPPVIEITQLTPEEVAPISEILPKDVPFVPSDVSLLPCNRFMIDDDDLPRRVLAGLIVLYQQNGHTDAVYATTRRMLEDGGLSAKTVSALLTDLRRSERVIHEQSYQRLNISVRDLWAAGDWSALVALCRQIISLPDAQPGDFAWLALAMHKAGEEPDTIVYILNRVPADAIVRLPKDAVRALLRDLAGAGYWSVTDKYAPLLPNTGGWRTRYNKRREQFIDVQLEAAERDLAAGEIDTAEVEAQHVLDIEPTHSRALLLLGRVYFAKDRLVDARRCLTPLVDDPSVVRDAVIALAEMDIAEGYLLDARKRLDILPHDAQLDTLLRAVEHRIDRTPVVQVEPVKTTISPDTLRRNNVKDVWAATFAVRLTSVRAVREVPQVDMACAELLTALSRLADGMGLQTAFAWRYVGGRGSLRIALLCRVEAHSETGARDAADGLWNTLKSLLPLQDEQVYAYEPVMSLTELEFLRTPVTVESAVEITRRELLLAVGDNDEVYAMQPFSMHQGSLHRLLRALADQPETTVLDIHFQPTALLPWERSAIKRMLEADNGAGDDNPMSFFNPFGSGRDERVQQAAFMYPEFLLHTEWLAFVVRIHLVTQGKLNTALPNIAATGLFGPSRYEIVPANFERDLDIVRDNLRDVACERWGYSAAPPKLERLRYLLMPAEALTATRIPVPGVDGLPGLPVLKIKAAPLPSNLPQNGVVIGESVTPVRGRPVTIRATLPDRMRHTYVVGRTGTGKSTLLQNLALQDIEAGLGVGIIDPHGDLVEAILGRIPPHRLQDVVLFDPSDTERPIGLNILDVKGTFEKNMVVAEFIGLMYSMFDPHKIGIVGPRFENAVRNAMLTAMEIPGSTLVEVVRILSDRKYLADCLEIITDPVVRSYWKDIVGNQSDFHKSEVLDYITSKFGRFVTDHLVRNIIGQSENTLDFAQIMDNGGILLVNLAKGKIGPQNSHFLGLLLVPRLLIAALSRARVDVRERRLFSLYVDEFHNFTTPAFSVMLSEARKYGLALTVANQFISQLDDAIRESVFGNIGTLLTFQVGIKDAHFMMPEMYPVFNVDDMVNLPNYHLLAKMLINGSAAPQFPVRTLPDGRVPNTALGEAIRAHSRRRYGRESFLVGHEIQQRFGQTPKERVQNGEKTPLDILEDLLGSK